MIHTLTFIRFLFPLLLLLAFFCLYKKQYRCMKSFMWNTYERVFVAEYQQYKKIKVQKFAYV